MNTNVTTKPAQSFMSACKEFFGTRDGQTALDFAKEVRALNDADRAEITAGLTALGYVIEAPKPV